MVIDVMYEQRIKFCSARTKLFRIYGRTRMQCPVLVFKLLRDHEQIPEKA